MLARRIGPKLPGSTKRSSGPSHSDDQIGPRRPHPPDWPSPCSKPLFPISLETVQYAQDPQRTHLVLTCRGRAVARDPWPKEEPSSRLVDRCGGDRDMTPSWFFECVQCIHFSFSLSDWVSIPYRQCKDTTGEGCGHVTGGWPAVDPTKNPSRAPDKQLHKKMVKITFAYLS
jgi:hypothetical protein